MNIYYLDEQEGETGSRQFTAVCAAKMSAERVCEFRKAYYPELYDMVASHRGTKANVIDRENFVQIHGVDLLREFPDEFKLKILRHLLDCFSRSGGSFFRLGYYIDTMPDYGKQNRNERVQMCMLSFLLALKKNTDAVYSFVSEFDREGLRKIFGPLSEHIPFAFRFDKSGDGRNMSFDYKNFVGHYYAKKTDIGCQLADIGGYLALKRENGTSEFALKLADIYQDHINLFELDEIISLNESTPEEIKRKNNADKYVPLRGWCNIVPTD